MDISGGPRISFRVPPPRGMSLQGSNSPGFCRRRSGAGPSPASWTCTTTLRASHAAYRYKEWWTILELFPARLDLAFSRPAMAERGTRAAVQSSATSLAGLPIGGPTGPGPGDSEPAPGWPQPGAELDGGYTGKPSSLRSLLGPKSRAHLRVLPKRWVVFRLISGATSLQ